MIDTPDIKKLVDEYELWINRQPSYINYMIYSAADRARQRWLYLVTIYSNFSIV